MSKYFNINSEEREGFLVDTKRKKIWLSQLKMLEIVERICKKYNIKYYAISGTLLGAVRHNGFIPWDDDLDIAMLREDYNKFLYYAQNEISGRYFFQTPLTDINYYKDHARIRDSYTTGICEKLDRNGCNNGIYIDIIPLDRHDNSIVDKFITFYVKFLSGIMEVKTHHNIKYEKNIISILLFPIANLFNIKKTYLHRERILTSYSKKESDKVSMKIRIHGISQEKLTWKISDFSSIQYYPFENMKISVPSGYDDILKTQYGDYMEFPPISERTKHHHIIFDPDVPYTKYIEKMKNDRK